MRDTLASLWLNRLGQHKFVAAIVIFTLIVSGIASLIKNLNEIYKFIPIKEVKTKQIAPATEWIIYFDYDKSSVSTAMAPELEEIVTYLNENPKKNVLLEGYSSVEEIIDVVKNAEDDLSIDQSYGYEFAAKRAQSVKEYLIYNNVARSRILVRELSILYRLDESEDIGFAKNRAVRVSIQ